MKTRNLVIFIVGVLFGIVIGAGFSTDTVEDWFDTSTTVPSTIEPLKYVDSSVPNTTIESDMSVSVVDSLVEDDTIDDVADTTVDPIVSTVPDTVIILDNKVSLAG